MADEVNERIALAWRELRRSATTSMTRTNLLGPNAPSLEPGQLDALEILVTRLDHGWRMSDFAAALRVEPSTATRAIDRLTQLGFAERDRDPHDKRVVIVRVTMLGASMAIRAHRRRTLGIGRILEQFTDAERLTLANYLDRFVNALDEHLNETPRI